MENDYFDKLNEQIRETELRDFKKIMVSPFGTSSDTQDAFLNWRFSTYDSIGNYTTLADGYFQAGFFLLQNLLSDKRDHKADIWIFPILFNFIHATELYLNLNNSYL